MPGAEAAIASLAKRFTGHSIAISGQTVRIARTGSFEDGLRLSLTAENCAVAVGALSGCLGAEKCGQQQDEAG